MYTKLREYVFNVIVDLDAADTEYIAAADISNQYSGKLFIKRGSDNVKRKTLVNDSMVNDLGVLMTPSLII